MATTRFSQGSSALRWRLVCLLLAGCYPADDPTYTTITVNVRGAGPGSGQVVDGGTGEITINCTIIAANHLSTPGNRCDDAFSDALVGGTVSVVATASPGSVHTGWSTGTGACTSVVGGLGQTCAMNYTASSDQTFTVTATFDLSDGVVTVRVDGTGAGTGRVAGTGGGALPSNPFAIDCTITAGTESGTCQDTFATGAAGGTVSLSVTVFPPNTFGGWGTGCSSISGSTCSLTFTPFETRTFSLAPRFDLPSPVPGTITVVVNGTGNGVGTVQDDGTVTPAGSFVINCLIQAGVESGPCQDSFDHVGAGSVSLIATASTGSTLISWSGCPVVNGGTCTLDFGVSETRTFTIAPRFDTPTELIAFNTDRDGDREIYTVTPDGLTLTRLTNQAGSDEGPNFSRDGLLLVFRSNRDGNQEIYRMNRDGSNPVRLTDNDDVDASPAFSRDASRVVFESDRTGKVELWLMNASNGSGLFQLTSTNGDDSYPDWSPVDDLIVFSSTGVGDEIWTINANGTGMTRLTNNNVDDNQARWSPDGMKIVFASTRTGNGDIYVMDRNGGNVRQITSGTGTDEHPAWSPDGSKIIFSSDRNGPIQLYVVNSDGTGTVQRFLTSTVRDDHPSWGKKP